MEQVLGAADEILGRIWEELRESQLGPELSVWLGQAEMSAFVGNSTESSQMWK